MAQLLFKGCVNVSEFGKCEFSKVGRKRNNFLFLMLKHEKAKTVYFMNRYAIHI